MKPHLLLLCLLIAPLHAADLPVLAAPDFKEPLPAEFKIVHGMFDPKDGVLICAEKPENKHVAVLWHQVAWNTGVFECDFRFDGSKSLIIGCDGRGVDKPLAHTGRVVITPKLLSIAEDSVKPSHTLTKAPCDLQPGVWHRLRIEWSGDKIIAQVGDQRIEATHPYLASPKTRSWIAVGGQTASIRALKIHGKR